MKKNVGNIDRAIRILVAIGVVGIYFTGMISGIVALVLLALSGILIATSFMSFCPLYLPLGLSTRTQGELEEEEQNQ